MPQEAILALAETLLLQLQMVATQLASSSWLLKAKTFRYTHLPRMVRLKYSGVAILVSHGRVPSSYAFVWTTVHI